MKQGRKGWKDGRKEGLEERRMGEKKNGKKEEWEERRIE